MLLVLTLRDPIPKKKKILDLRGSRGSKTRIRITVVRKGCVALHHFGRECTRCELLDSTSLSTIPVHSTIDSTAQSIPFFLEKKLRFSRQLFLWLFLSVTSVATHDQNQKFKFLMMEERDIRPWRKIARNFSEKPAKMIVVALHQPVKKRKKWNRLCRGIDCAVESIVLCTGIVVKSWKESLSASFINILLQTTPTALYINIAAERQLTHQLQLSESDRFLKVGCNWSTWPSWGIR